MFLETLFPKRSAQRKALRDIMRARRHIQATHVPGARLNISHPFWKTLGLDVSKRELPHYDKIVGEFMHKWLAENEPPIPNIPLSPADLLNVALEGPSFLHRKVNLIEGRCCGCGGSIDEEGYCKSSPEDDDRLNMLRQQLLDQLYAEYRTTHNKETMLRIRAVEELGASK